MSGSNSKSFQKVNIFIHESLQFLNKLLYLHWNTVKYPFHVSTEKAYNDWKDLLDSFVEKYIGSHINGRENILLNATPHTINRNTLLNDDIRHLLVLLDELKTFIEPKSLVNLLDDFQNSLYQLVYLLKLE